MCYSYFQGNSGGALVVAREAVTIIDYSYLLLLFFFWGGGEGKENLGLHTKAMELVKKEKARS